VKIDPRVHPTAEDMRKQFALSEKVTASISSLHKAVNQIRDLKGAAPRPEEGGRGKTPAGAPLVAAAENLEGKRWRRSSWS